MTMKNPAHPGEVLSDLFLAPLGLTITEAANGLGVSRKTLSEIVNGRTGISPEMALRIHKAFDGPSPETWLGMQANYDLARVAAKTAPLKVKRLYHAPQTVS